MFGVWRGRPGGVEAHHAVELVGPRDLSGFHIHRPTAEAGHALRFFQLRFARAQGFFRPLALGDVAGHGGAARDAAFRIPDWKHRDRQLNAFPAFAKPFGLVAEDCFSADDSIDKAQWPLRTIGRPQ